MEAIASYFKFAERKTDLATEVRAGVTTFMVMVLHHLPEPEHHRRWAAGRARHDRRRCRPAPR